MLIFISSFGRTFREKLPCRESTRAFWSFWKFWTFCTNMGEGLLDGGTELVFSVVANIANLLLRSVVFSFIVVGFVVVFLVPFVVLSTADIFSFVFSSLSQ